MSEIDKILILKNRDIELHPEDHQHSYEHLTKCCMVDGVLYNELIEAHKNIVPQRNPGGCDVISGPCSCGAWH